MMATLTNKKLRYSEFKDRISINDFEEALNFSPTHQSGANDIGYCLFPQNHKHGDTTGKFAIEREKKLFNCFGCGGGDLLSLVMLVKDLEVEEATEWLYQFTTPERSDDEFADELLAMLEDEEQSVTLLPYFNERVLDRFGTDPTYFYGRGFDATIIERYNLRYSEDVRKPAPTKSDRDGKRFKVDDDYIGPASIWPHYWQGRLVGWQSRWSDWDKERTRVPKWLPKWTNTSDFPKSTTLYNYDDCLQAKGRIVVCESLGTVLFCESFGVPALAYFGSQPTAIQLRLLRRFTQGVILAPDNDSNLAGDKILDTVEYLERFIPVYIAEKVEGPDGADLGDYAQTDNPERYLRYHLEARVHEASLSVDF